MTHPLTRHVLASPVALGIVACLAQLSGCGPGNNTPDAGVTSCVPAATDSKGDSSGVLTLISSLSGSPTYYTMTLPRSAFGNEATDATIDYMVHEASGTPKALLVLIAGGQLTAGIEGASDGGSVTAAGGNFLVRSAHLFAGQGYRVLTVDRPSDADAFIVADFPANTGSGGALDGYRVDMAHAVDLSAMINRANTGNLPVVVLGTSRGGVSAVAQSALGEAIAVSNPVTNAGVGHPVSSGDAAAVGVPAYVLWHAQDGCSATPPSSSASLAGAFADGFGEGCEGGFSPTGTDPCGAVSYHGFLGIETCAVTRTTAWIDGMATSFPATRPTANPGSASVTIGNLVTIDLASLSAAAAGGALSYELPIGSTRWGSAVSLSGSTVTFTAGSQTANDAFVYVVREAGGGTSNNVVSVTIQ